MNSTRLFYKHFNGKLVRMIDVTVKKQSCFSEFRIEIPSSRCWGYFFRHFRPRVAKVSWSQNWQFYHGIIRQDEILGIWESRNSEISHLFLELGQGRLGQVRLGQGRKGVKSLDSQIPKFPGFQTSGNWLVFGVPMESERELVVKALRRK